MAKSSTYSIPLRGAQQATERYTLVLNDEFFKEMESSDVLGGNVNVEITVTRKGEANYFTFACKGEIMIPCDRCLEPMRHEVDTDYELTVKFGDEYNDETDGLLIVPDSDNDLNVASLLYDTVALTIPISHVHAEGECDEATWAALQAHTAHSISDEGATYGGYDDEAGSQDDAAFSDENDEGNIDPRWAELLKLKDNKLKNK